MQDRYQLRELLEPSTEALGYELVDIEIAGGQGNALVRIYIDAPGGINVDDCETVSRQMSAILDVEDPIPGHYTLEVSSPGLDRPLVKPEHFRKAVGQRVRLRLHRHHLGRRRFLGQLLEADHENVVVNVDNEDYTLELGEIESARLAPEF